MLDDPLQILISLVVASGFAMYPLGFLLSACSECCGCPIVEEFNRCLRWVRQDLPESYGTQDTALPARSVSQQVATYKDAGLREVATAREMNASITLDRAALQACGDTELTEEFQIIVPSSGVPPGSNSYVEGAEDTVIRTITLRIIGQSTPYDEPDFGRYAEYNGVIEAPLGQPLVLESPIKNFRNSTPCGGSVQYADSYVLSGHARIEGSVFTRGYMQSLMQVEAYTEYEQRMLRLTFTPPAPEYLRHAPIEYTGATFSEDPREQMVVLRYIFKASAQAGASGNPDAYTVTHFNVDIALEGNGWRFLEPPVFYGPEAYGDFNTTITEYGEPLTVRGGFGDPYTVWAATRQIEVFDAYVLSGSQYLDGVAVTRQSLKGLVTPRFANNLYSYFVYLDWNGGGSMFDYVPQVSGIVQIRYVFRMTHGDGRWVYWTRDFHPGGGGQLIPSGMVPPSFSSLPVPEVLPLYTSPHYECCQSDTTDHIEPPIEPYWDAENSEIVVGTAWMVREDPRKPDTAGWEIDLPKLIYRPAGAALLIPGRIEPRSGTYYDRSRYSERATETGFVIYGLQRRFLWPNDFDYEYLSDGYVSPVLSPSLVASWMAGGHALSVQIKQYDGTVQSWTVTVTPPEQMCGVDLCQGYFFNTLYVDSDAVLGVPGYYSYGEHPKTTVRFDADPVPLGVNGLEGSPPDECGAPDISLTLPLHGCEYKNRYLTCAGGSTTCWGNAYGTIAGSAECEALGLGGGNFLHEANGGSGSREWVGVISIGYFYDADLLGATEDGPARTTVIRTRPIDPLTGQQIYSAASFGTYRLGEEGDTGRQTAGCANENDFQGAYLTTEGIALYNATQSCAWGGELTLSVPTKKIAVFEYSGGFGICHDDRLSLVGGDYVSSTRYVACFGSSYGFTLQRSDGETIGASVWTHKSKWCQQTPFLQMLYLGSALPILRTGCEHEPEHMKYLQTICIRNPNQQPDNPCTNSGFSLSPGDGSGEPTGIGIASQTESPIDETTGAFLVQWQNPNLQYKFTPTEGDEFVSPGYVRYDGVITIKPYAIENTGIENYLADIADVATVVKSGTGGCDISWSSAFAGIAEREDQWNAGYDFRQWLYLAPEQRVVNIRTGQCLNFIFKNNNDGGPKCSVSVSRLSGEDIVKITRGSEGTAFTLEGLPHPAPGEYRGCILRVRFGGRIPPFDFTVSQFE
jgi:hypothetical protein